MQLDPTRWLVSLAGFTFDWIITREWGRILPCLIPVFLMGGLGLAVTFGARLDRGRLAQWYMELGDKEIAGWEQTWAPLASTAKADEQDAGKVVDSEDAAKEVSEAASQQPEKQVSRFAEALFHRVQMLVPSDRSQWVIAATLAQRGAIEQAKTMLARVAPADRAGYAPAHALLASFLLFEYQQQDPKNEQTAQQLMHHAWQARLWERTPRLVLLAGSDLFLMQGKQAESLSILATSAERYPEDYFPLAQRAKLCNNERLAQQAISESQKYLQQQLVEAPQDNTSRLRLAQTFAMAGDLDKAEAALQQAPNLETEAELKRGLSQIYLMDYAESLRATDGKVSVNLEYLDAALRSDASNPAIAEEVAKLVRMQGPQPSDELIQHLNERLAEGTATAATHALLGELRLVRNEHEQAIFHLEQVILREPTAADCLNNLAFCLAELHPERLEEALGLSNRAIAASKEKPNADYYDTLSFVLSKMERHKESLAAIETAIELNRRRPDFHLRAAEEYRQLNQEPMAKIHEQVAERVRAEEAARIEAQRIEAERIAAEKLEAERQAAIRKKAEELEAIRYAAEQALIEIEEELAAKALVAAEAANAAKQESGQGEPESTQDEGTPDSSSGNGEPAQL